MRGEIERCKLAIQKVKEGKKYSYCFRRCRIIWYGRSHFRIKRDIDVEIIPGVTAAFSAASELGSPIMHDFATISLSDLLTPWDIIEQRIEKAAEGDFVIVIYNPRSKGRKEHLKKAVDIMLKYKQKDTPVGIVRNSGRINRKIWLTTLGKIPYEEVDMLILIIGNTNTYIKDGQMITPRVQY